MSDLLRKSLLAIASFVPTSALVAAPFYFELGGDYITGDTDLDDIEFDEENVSLHGAWYFEAVDDSRGALREAPYIQRASRLAFNVDLEEIDDDAENKIDTTLYEINGRFIAKESGWYLDLGYTNADADYDEFALDTPTIGFRPEFDGYAASIGKYLFENTSAYIGYTQLDFNSDPFDVTEAESETDSVGLGLKHFGSITDEIAFSIAANYYFLDLQVPQLDELDDDGFDDSGEVFSVTAVVYPLRELGIGLGYTDSDDLMGAPYLTPTGTVRDGLEAFVDWFVTERISVRATYNNSEYDLANPEDLDDPGEVDTDSLLVGLQLRF